MTTERRVFNTTSGHRPQQNINRKIFPVCLILHIRESGMVLLFINDVFTGTAGGVMTSICVFHVKTDISPLTLIACKVFSINYNIVSRVLQGRYSLTAKNKEKNCIVSMLLYNIGFLNFIVDFEKLLHAVRSLHRQLAF